MRTLQLAGHWPFNLYDVARFGCHDYFAAEPMPAAENFEDGQGPGLFVRKAGAAGSPEPVEGSEARRIYALSAFTRSDGAQQLVGLGVRTADLFAASYPLPQRWALVTPHDLIVFVSTDGVTWAEHSLRDLERGGGDYPLATYYGEPGVDALEEDGLKNRDDSIQNAFMNSPNAWEPGTSAAGAPCLWCCSGRNLLEWDGWDVRITALNARASDVAVHGGKFYLAAGSRSQIVAANGNLVFMPGPAGDNAPTAFRSVPISTDGRVNIVSQAGNAALAIEGANLQLCDYVGGQWVVVYAVAFLPESTDQQIAAVQLAELPAGTLSLDTDEVEWLVLQGQHNYLDLGRVTRSINGTFAPDVFAIRRASSRAYVFQRKDFQDQGGFGLLPDMQRGTSPILEVLSAPNLADFDLTAGRPDGSGYLVGTADGWVMGARLDANVLKPLARLDGAVLRLLRRAGRYYALTAGAVWRSDGGVNWTTIHEAGDDGPLRDALLDGDTLVVASEGGVLLLDVAGASPAAAEFQPLEWDVTCCARFEGAVYLFGESADGLVARIEDGIATAAPLALFATERVTAAMGGANALWAGTESGKLLRFDGAAWSLMAETGHPIGALGLSGDFVLIGLTDGTGTFRVWDGTAISTEPLSVTCATDARLFFPPPGGGDEGGGGGGGGGDPDDGDGGGDSDDDDEEGGGGGSGGGGVCGAIVFTDAGPVWLTCPADGEAVWFSSPRPYGEIGDVFDAVTCAPLHASGSLQRARCFIGPPTAGDDLRAYQPIPAGVRANVLRPDRSYRFAVAAPADEAHGDYEFQVFRREWVE